MDDVVTRAKLVAYSAHAAVGQKRKYTNHSYIVHPEAVVKLVKSVPHTPDMLAAAWLHDVVEDTGVTIFDLSMWFDDPVVSLVEWLTDVSKPEDGNRAKRKTLDREHTAAAPPEAKTIKLADLIDNSATILKHDPDFARVYIREKAALLEVLKEGDPTLHLRATRIVEAYRESTS